MEQLKSFHKYEKFGPMVPKLCSMTSSRAGANSQGHHNLLGKQSNDQLWSTVESAGVGRLTDSTPDCILLLTAMSYVGETGFSAAILIKSKHCAKSNVGEEKPTWNREQG